MCCLSCVCMSRGAVRAGGCSSARLLLRLSPVCGGQGSFQVNTSPRRGGGMAPVAQCSPACMPRARARPNQVPKWGQLR
eukprot:jgi/Mesvir1/17788/Mv25364-RA.1